MTGQELKNSILQLAIQGKLVKQRKEEGTAEKLYKEIQKEKEKLIKEKKIRKTKALKKISEEEIPFEIPKSWKWVRLGEVTNYGEVQTIKPQNISSDVWVLELVDIEKESSVLLEKVLNKTRKSKSTKKIFHEGDVLYGKLRPYLKKVIVATGKGVCSTEIVPFKAYKGIIPQYIALFLKAPAIDFIINNTTHGMDMPRLGKQAARNLSFPLPPLAEQKRIVDKLEDLMPYVEQYGEAHSKLKELNKNFPEDMQKAILQYAIQGKLVEQREEEGTAEKLYKEIQKEKKIKRIKALKKITPEEIPFEIPKSWKWVRLGDLGEIVGGGTPKTGNRDFWDNGNIPWLTPADMKHVEGKYVEKGRRNITKLGLAKSSAQLMPQGTILYSSRAPIGYIAIAKNDITTNQGFKSLVPINREINVYLYYCLIARTDEIRKRGTGTTFKEISGREFGLTIIPLPPLAEQKRIVKKLEELLPLCDLLKAKISQ